MPEEEKEKKENETVDDIVIEEEADAVRKERVDRVKKLKDELELCKKERQEYLDGWQRMKADSINLKKEEERKRAELADFVRERVYGEILPVLDSFDLAFGNKSAWEGVDVNWRKGIEYIHSQLSSILKEGGLETIDPNGMPFDPHVHTSVEIVLVEEKNLDGMVLEVLQRGYVFKDKIIRPARVKVGKYKQ